MRIVSVSKLQGNEILGKQIFDDSGRVLLNAGTKLNPLYIDKLKHMEIESIYVDDAISKEVTIEETISDKTRQMSKAALKSTADSFCHEGRADNDSILKSVNLILNEITSKKNALLNVSEMRSNDNTIFSHSVNVCVLSSIIGLHLGYNMLRIKDVSVGAILHDIGKIKILNDKKAISEFKSKNELDRHIKLMHPKIGYDILGNENFCSTFSKVAVLMHHEKVDGTGYPLKLKGSDINEIAQLVSICDTFDNLINGSDNQPAKPVYEALECISAMSGSSFDSNIVKTFIMNIASYPSGSGVILNTNEKCLVVRQNNSMPMRPVLKVIYDKTGNLITEPYEIDMLKELTLFITDICNL